MRGNIKDQMSSFTIVFMRKSFRSKFHLFTHSVWFLGVGVMCLAWCCVIFKHSAKQLFWKDLDGPKDF